MYTDSDEVIFDAMRPLILNGIDHLTERADLADRALILYLPRIDSKHRKDEQQLYADFERELPRILGALCTAVSTALASIDQVKLASKPRMADFALWATAAAPGLGLPSETFLKAYCRNRSEAVQDTLDADAVAGAICELMDKGLVKDGTETWEGTCKQLLSDLDS